MEKAEERGNIEVDDLIIETSKTQLLSDHAARIERNLQVDFPFLILLDPYKMFIIYIMKEEFLFCYKLINKKW